MIEDAYKNILIFHGHTGIWAALGYRAGKLIVDHLKPEGYKDLEAIIELKLETPPACFLDGFQLTSHCTIGRKNLEIREVDQDNISVEATDLRANKRLTLLVHADMMGEIKKRQVKSKGKPAHEEEDTKWILSLPDDELFHVTE